MFNIDFTKLITWLLPSFLRREFWVAWMKALCSGVISMYGEFIAKRAADLYLINHDSRVFSMQAVFNDRFDPIARRIYITDGFAKQRIYLFTREESKPIYLDPAISLYNRADYADTGIDFIVWVPSAIFLSSQNLIELTALINQYKLAGKRFKIYRG